MIIILITVYRWELISPLLLTENGNRYIVTLVDFFLNGQRLKLYQIIVPNLSFLIQDDVQVSVLCSVFFIPVLHNMHIRVSQGTSSYCLSINVAGI